MSNSQNLSFQRERSTPAPLEDIVAALKAGIETAGLWILHEIDPQALLKRGGFDIAPARQILFFHPRYMVRLLDAEPAALLEAPLKFAVMDAGGSRMLRWLDPAGAFGRYGSPELAALGLELATVCATVADGALEGVA